MARILTSDTETDVTETIAYDETDHTVIVQRTQDAQPVLDAVAAANLHGVREVEGLGIAQCEVPVNVAIEFCQKRGIPWEAFYYTNKYDDEWGRFLKEHPKLCYRPAKKFHSVAR